MTLRLSYDDTNKFELSIDEAGRGCLFGRVYVACVVLPKDGSFCGDGMKDSKKYTSKKKINAAADYIKQHALAWNVSYIEHDVIDKINILKATMKGMHDCIKNVVNDLRQRGLATGDIATEYQREFMAIIDGNYFTPYREFDEMSQTIREMPHVTIEKGDGTYLAIACASILAKTARDNYILDLCKECPELTDKYGFDTNMGYGTKKHMDGIRAHGRVEGHRMSFSSGEPTVPPHPLP